MDSNSNMSTAPACFSESCEQKAVAMRLTRSGRGRDAFVHGETGGRSRKVFGFFITRHTRSAGPAGDITRRRQMESSEWELQGVSARVDQPPKMHEEVDRHAFVRTCPPSTLARPRCSPAAPRQRIARPPSALQGTAAHRPAPIRELPEHADMRKCAHRIPLSIQCHNPPIHTFTHPEEALTSCALASVCKVATNLCGHSAMPAIQSATMLREAAGTSDGHVGTAHPAAWVGGSLTRGGKESMGVRWGQELPFEAEGGVCGDGRTSLEGQQPEGRPEAAREAHLLPNQTNICMYGSWKVEKPVRRSSPPQ